MDLSVPDGSRVFGSYQEGINGQGKESGMERGEDPRLVPRGPEEAGGGGRVSVVVSILLRCNGSIRDSLESSRECPFCFPYEIVVSLHKA